VTQHAEWQASSARGKRVLAGIAILVGVCIVCVGLAAAFLYGMSGLGGMGDCGTGCQEANARDSARANLWFYVAIGGAVLTIIGVVARIVIPRPPPPPPAPLPPHLPIAEGRFRPK